MEKGRHASALGRDSDGGALLNRGTVIVREKLAFIELRSQILFPVSSLKDEENGITKSATGNNKSKYISSKWEEEKKMNHLPTVEKLRGCTERHYNCAQSLLVPFRDVTGLSEEKSDRLGNLFGSGMHHGGMCGALTAAVMILSLAGFQKDTSTAMIREFKQRHDSTMCRDLLAASAQKGLVRKEHCDGLVYEMTRYLDDVLGKNEHAERNNP